MGIPRHNFLKKLRKQKEDIIKRFRSDCKMLGITEDIKVVISFDGEYLRYYIKQEDKTLSYETTDVNRETLFSLLEVVHADFEKIEIHLSSPKQF